MKPAPQWLEELANAAPDDNVHVVEGRGGEPTLKVGNVFLHSRYRPREEAARLIESAGLDLQRPILVVGLGLGYHVAELLARDAEVAVLEPSPAVAKLALEGPLRDTEVLLGVGDLDDIAATGAFDAFAGRIPQTLVHPPTAKIHPEFCDRAVATTAKAALGKQRLRIAVVGPMYGGSLPITGYLERAFRALGHVTLNIDNSQAWPLYQAATEGVQSETGSAQLGNLLAHFLSEWTYARVAEFAPDICIVMAQAPVGPRFPARLAKEGIVTAFWYVENWRHFPYWRELAPLYDCFFHIQPREFEDQLTQAGCPCHAFVQTACDPEIHKPVELTEDEQDEFGCDLSFAGAGYTNRIEIFKGMTDYDFKIWGVGWGAKELTPLLCHAEERFTPERFTKIVAGSKINLNLHSSAVHMGVDPKCDAINPRVFEIAACGGFQLCDPCIGLDALFDFDTELPVYRDLAGLRAQVDHFLAHPDERREFARRARQRVLRDHTYEHRAQEMLDCILEHYGGRLLRKGVRIQHTMAEMAERVGPETPLGTYLASLPPDCLFTHENINDLLVSATNKMTYPEQVFVYMREVRNFAELLLSQKR
ncbi:MAG: glycosyltransferase [Nitrospiraceae bacterium]|nr:glycosyltransferase [Nitrospiraceae bacterium]